MTLPSFKLKFDSTFSIHVEYFYTAIERLNKRAKYTAVEVTDCEHSEDLIYQDGYPIPKESNVVLYTVSPLSSGYGGLTFVGGRGGGCAIYIFRDITKKSNITSEKYILRCIHELLHLFDKNSDGCGAWVNSLPFSLKNLILKFLWYITKGDGERYLCMIVQREFYNQLWDEVISEIADRGEERVKLPHVVTNS